MGVMCWSYRQYLDELFAGQWRERCETALVHVVVRVELHIEHETLNKVRYRERCGSPRF